MPIFLNMLLKSRWVYFLIILLKFSLLIAADPPIQASVSRKLDDTTVPAPTDQKCTPCTSSPPPPPPPSPCPPPPALPPPPPSLCPPPPALPPPPPPKKPPSSYCPPPPSFIYITGPPGNLYPIDNDFSGAAGRATAPLPVLIVCGLLGLLIRIGL